MDRSKIQLFENSTNESFPSYRVLSVFEVSIIKKRLTNKFQLPIDSKGIVLVEAIDMLEHEVKLFTANDNFNLIKCLNFLGVYDKEEILINWFQFDDIDEIACIDLNNYFYDIWFETADDMDIFDSSLSWILSIRHDGYIKFWSSSI
jgi:hypothetical protein